MTKTPGRYGANYQRLRREILATKPLCSYCGTADATTVDHVIELDVEHGPGDSRDNLVPACLSCNSRKGQAYATKKHGGRTNGKPAGHRKDVTEGRRPGYVDAAGVWWSTCRWCGITFRPGVEYGNGHDATGHYCSPDCAADGRRRNWTTITYVTVWDCSVCGQQTESRGTKPNERQTCGQRECQQARNGRLAAERANPDATSTYAPLRDTRRTITEQYDTVAPRSGLAKGSRAGQRLGPAAAVETAQAFSTTLPDPVPSLHALSLSTGNDPATSEPNRPDSAVFGRTEPRLRTPRDGMPTYGDEAISVAEEHFGRPLYPWQKLLLRDILAHDDAGDLVSNVALFTVARQQGKSYLAQALILWALTRWPLHRGEPVKILSAANRMTLAEELMRERLWDILVERYGAKGFQSFGRMGVEMPDGSWWRISAANRNAAHGFSPTLAILDEIWAVDDEVISQGFLPAQRAQRSPLMILTSTAGDSTSSALLRWRADGIRAVQTGDTDLYFSEWSPPDGADLESEDTWLWANPSVGHGNITVKQLRRDYKQNTRADFHRAFLNTFVASARGWLEPGIWAGLAVTVDDLPPASVVAIDSTPSDNRYSAVAAHVLEDGRIVVTVPIQSPTEAGLWRELTDWIPSGCTVAVTPGLEIHVPPALAGRKVRVGYSQIAAWTSLVHARIMSGEIVHLGDPALADHLARAAASTTRDGEVVISTAKSAGAVELARCLVWACQLALAPRKTGRPSIATSGR